jgi:cysteine-rich repeat protein
MRRGSYREWIGGVCALVIACAVDDPSGYRFGPEGNLGDAGSTGDHLPAEPYLAGSAGASGERVEGGSSGSPSEACGSAAEGGAGSNGLAGTAHGDEAGCGDGNVAADEACDDENVRTGDGCALCEVEVGWRCADEPSICEDINECTEQTDDCDTNATCKNVPASYSCSCDLGYEGDGTSCTELASCASGDTRSCAVGGSRGACAEGVQTCSAAGEWEACSIQPEGHDSCVSGNDDDCDGSVNEGCACEAGDSRKCSQGGFFGACATGAQKCDDAGSWSDCNIAPGTDTCAPNNDDDCDGKPNEGCLCLEGSSRVCGPCGDGEETCLDGKKGTHGACSGGSAQQTYYLDADGDGHASTAATTVCGAAPSMYITGPVDDCCDSDSRVHPGAGFTTSTDGGCGRATDFNCDDQVEPLYTPHSCTAACGDVGQVCPWSPFPGCGQTLFRCSCYMETDMVFGCFRTEWDQIVQQCR